MAQGSAHQRVRNQKQLTIVGVEKAFVAFEFLVTQNLEQSSAPHVEHHLCWAREKDASFVEPERFEARRSGSERKRNWIGEGLLRVRWSGSRDGKAVRKRGHGRQ